MGYYYYNCLNETNHNLDTILKLFNVRPMNQEEHRSNVAEFENWQKMVLTENGIANLITELPDLIISS